MKKTKKTGANDATIFKKIRRINEKRIVSHFQGLSISTIERFFDLDRKQVMTIKRQEIGRGDTFDRMSVNRLFGLENANHAFKAPDIDWGIGLTEPQVTGALAYLLDADEPDIKAARVLNFVKAMGCGLPIKLEEAQTCEVFAEFPVRHDNRVGRIDLLLIWKHGSKACILAIEAKFGHDLSTGQLELYQEFLQNKHLDAKIDHVVLALKPAVMDQETEATTKLWRFESWHAFWLRFQRGGYDSDLSLSTFMRQLWSRFDGLEQ